MKLKTEAILRPAQMARKTQFTGLVRQTFKPKANHENNIAFEKARKEAGKKSRDDKSIVAEKLFALFEKHQYYRYVHYVCQSMVNASRSAVAIQIDSTLDSRGSQKN